MNVVSSKLGKRWNAAWLAAHLLLSRLWPLQGCSLMLSGCVLNTRSTFHVQPLQNNVETDVGLLQLIWVLPMMWRDFMSLHATHVKISVDLATWIFKIWLFRQGKPFLTILMKLGWSFHCHCGAKHSCRHWAQWTVKYKQMVSTTECPYLASLAYFYPVASIRC